MKDKRAKPGLSINFKKINKAVNDHTHISQAFFICHINLTILKNKQ